MASFTPSLASPAYQSRHFTVVTDAAASGPVRYGLRAMSAEQMVCSLQARTLEWCLDRLLEESAFAAQQLRCGGRCLLPVGARHVLVREGPAEQSLFTLAEALLREKGQDYDETLLAAVPSYAVWNGYSVTSVTSVTSVASVAQQVPSPRSAVDFESLSRFMLLSRRALRNRLKRMPSITGFERWKNAFVKNLATFSFLQCFFK